MEQKKKELAYVTLKYDSAFKEVFGDKNDTQAVTRLVSDLLDIPMGSIKSLTHLSTENIPDHRSAKAGYLDLLLDVDGQTVNIEIQLAHKADFKSRTLFYWAKLYYDGVNRGDNYNTARKTICINIVDYNISKIEDYHSCIEARERTTGEVFSDKFQIHFFELKKLDKYRKGKPVEEWLDLLNAKTEEDVMEIRSNTNIPEVKNVATKVSEFNADDAKRYRMIQEEIARLDELTEINAAFRAGREEGIEEGREEGREEGGYNMLVSLVKEGSLPISTAAKKAKMTEEEFRKLLTSNG